MDPSLKIAEAGAVVAERAFGPIARDDLRRYAEASGDLNPLHLDRQFAQQAGFNDVVVHGMLGMALLGRLLTESFPNWQLRAFRARFRNIINVDEPVHCYARLEGRDGTSTTLALEARTGTGVILIEGTATVIAPGGE
jgi:acyl dehydratase